MLGSAFKRSERQRFGKLSRAMLQATLFIFVCRVQPERHHPFLSNYAHINMQKTVVYFCLISFVIYQNRDKYC
jgi:hypothetical protein